MQKIFSGINLQLVQSLGFWNCWAVVFACVLYLLLKDRRQISPKFKLPDNLPVFVLIVCYVVSVIAITIVPVPHSEHYRPVSANILPLVKTYKTVVYLMSEEADHLLALDLMWNIVGNIIMFMPFGFLLPLIFTRTKRYRQVLLAAVAVSGTIELIQFFSRLVGNYRQADVDDVLLNASGAIAGYFIFRVFTKKGGSSKITN